MFCAKFFAEDPASTLHRYVWLYNEHLPQKALQYLTPIQAMKQWRSSHPHLFSRPVKNHPGPGTYGRNTEMNDETYHQRLRGEKRAAAIQAAMELFLNQGYHRTSLQQIAKRANVSTATLFKRFPTKAVLFEAIVEEFWAVAVDCTGTPAPGDPAAGLRKIGLDYAQRMRQPEMLALFRLIVGEALRFPDLGQMLYDKGFGPYLFRLSAYLEAETSAGMLNVTNPLFAARQFLAVIAGQAVWPELMVSGCGGTEGDVIVVVEEGVAMMLARYGKQARPASKST